MAYLYLALAIISEVIATSALKASAELTKSIPSMIVFIGFGTSFYFMALTLRTLPLGITYAIWSGVGIVLISLVGMFIYKETLDLPAIIGMGLIITGVIVIRFFSQSAGH